MRLASVSKALGGAAALALVAQGKLTLNDTIGQLLTALPSTWAPVTLAELLNHTSGLPDYTASKGFAEGLTSAPLQAPSPGELLGYVEDEPLRFTPGSRFAYSNSDNIVIALMLQAVTGLPYSTVLEREVFSPLGLSQTSLPSTATLREPFMHGYSIGSSGKPEDVSEFAPGWAWASGGVVSTPANLSRFISAYVRGATTNSATHTRQFQFIKNASSDPPGPGANSAGLAIFRYQTSCGTVYGHTGNLPGYTQFAAASANGSRSVTVSVNAQISPLSDPQQFRELRHVYDLAVCAALTG
jgi:D-alanyl-D-alanine carboxypeptidase